MKKELINISETLKDLERTLENQIEKLDLILSNYEDPSEPQWIYNIQAEQVSHTKLKFTWDTDYEVGKFDIKYEHYGEEWDGKSEPTEFKHSYEEYLHNKIDLTDGEVTLGFGSNRPSGIWLFNFEMEEENNELVDVELKKKSDEGQDDDSNDPEPEPKPTPEPEKTEKKITVFESNRSELSTPVPNGLIRHNGKYRVYFFERNNKQFLYSESSDLESWSSVKKSKLPLGGGTNLIQDNDGKVYAYQGEGHDLYIYDVVGSNLDEIKNKRLAYSWRIDGKLTMTIQDGTWYATGRVRGSADKSRGGWGDDLPDYPELSELPFIKQEYDKHLPSWADPDDYLKDRRGISLHTSKDGTEWSKGKIIADPKWYDEKPFRGWMEEGSNGIGDFYSSVMLDDNRMIIKSYMKEKDRVVDRWDYSPDMDIRRRFRFTGETILIPAVYQNGKVVIKSTDSIIPEKFHARKTPDEVEYATCRDCVEFGQTNNGNEIIRKNGYVYITYGYRDDVHYEAPGFDFYTGIYLYRIPEEKFDKLFK